MTKKLPKFLSLWLPPILWCLMIFKFSSGMVPVASKIYWQDFAVKKFGHIILFAMLAVLIYRALVGQGSNRKKAAIMAVALSFLYGITDEVHQMFTQGREARFRDVLIDGFGAAVVIYLIYKYFAKLPLRCRNLFAKLDIK